MTLTGIEPATFRLVAQCTGNVFLAFLLIKRFWLIGTYELWRTAAWMYESYTVNTYMVKTFNNSVINAENLKNLLTRILFLIFHFYLFYVIGVNLTGVVRSLRSQNRKEHVVKVKREPCWLQFFFQLSHLNASNSWNRWRFWRTRSPGHWR
jgi:hypothetical protein